MGSPGSPAYAICICMYYEHQFHQSIHDYSLITRQPPDTIMRCMRYVDDVLALITWDGNKPETKAYAHALTSCLAAAYHTNMELKREAIEHDIPFLQGTIVVHNAHVKVKYNNKNLPSILTTGKQKLFTVKHRHTFMSERQARNSILGALHRLRDTSDTTAQCIADTNDMYICFTSLGYSTNTFCSALHKLAAKTKEAHWDKISRLLRKTTPHHSKESPYHNTFNTHARQHGHTHRIPHNHH